MLKEINSTLISLIPKIQTPDKVTDFRPIACCNVIHKCISKLIINMMKGVLDKLVGLSQSAFVPQRHIHDNILLSQELLKGYDKKDAPKRVALKVDIQKAYDTVNYKFLEAILKGFGFHEKMIHWIMSCVTIVAYSVGIKRLLEVTAAQLVLLKDYNCWKSFYCQKDKDMRKDKDKDCLSRLLTG
ncbi:RNA-directed DNA polymerase, eukaryota, reverse transcriptase zinc-binding domain protein [Tanacetum coccineum]